MFTCTAYYHYTMSVHEWLMIEVLKFRNIIDGVNFVSYGI